MPEQAVDKGNIRAGPQPGKNIGMGGRMSEAGVHDDHFRAALLGTQNMLHGHGVSLGGEATLLIDVPSPALSTPRLAGLLVARYDFTGGRGLRDFPPRARPFNDRLEEGSGRIERERPAVEPAWEEDP